MDTLKSQYLIKGDSPVYKIVNLDRHGAIAHVALDTQYDRGIVLDDARLERHIITGEEQPSVAFRGSIPECRAWVREAGGAVQP